MTKTPQVEQENDHSDGGPDVSGAMRSHGFYNRHSLPQHEAAAFAEPLLRRAAPAIRPPPAGPRAFRPHAGETPAVLLS